MLIEDRGLSPGKTGRKPRLRFTPLICGMRVLLLFFHSAKAPRQDCVQPEPNEERSLLFLNFFQKFARPCHICRTRMTWGRCEMASSKYLRRQADLCWRLALATGDDDLGCIFIELAQDFLATADERDSAESAPDAPPSVSDPPDDETAHSS